jgi:leader peptidase (prepilin peptidase)/N-methyltransferase
MESTVNTELILSIYIFAFGAFIGSFLNVLIYRLPRNENFVMGRSRCPHCKEAIRWYDNVPLLSYLILRGRCRRCSEFISWRYPLVELLTGAFFLLSFELYGLSAQTGVISLFFALLLVATVIDFQHFIIPDKITYPGMVLGLALSFVNPELRPLDSLIGLLAGGVSLYLLAIVGDLLFKKESLGGGDIKLAAMLGAFLGWRAIIIIFFGAALLGLVYAIIQMTFSAEARKTRMIPFGPFLSMAALIALFFGDTIINFYLHEILMMPR